jgi:hypothetical protein
MVGGGRQVVRNGIENFGEPFSMVVMSSQFILYCHGLNTFLLQNICGNPNPKYLEIDLVSKSR